MKNIFFQYRLYVCIFKFYVIIERICKYEKKCNSLTDRNFIQAVIFYLITAIVAFTS